MDQFILLVLGLELDRITSGWESKALLNMLALAWQNCFQMIYERVLFLPGGEARARLYGKGGKKWKDIEAVSGARLSINGLRLCIQAPSEGAVDLAFKMVMKSEQHRLAAKEKVPDLPGPNNALKSDLLMAAFYTVQN